MKVSKCQKCIFCERKTYSIGAYRYCQKYEKHCLDIKEKDCLAFCEKSEVLRNVIEANNIECAKRIYEIQERLKR